MGGFNSIKGGEDIPVFDAGDTAYETNALKVIRHRAYDCCVYWHNYMDGNGSGAQAALKVV